MWINRYTEDAQSQYRGRKSHLTLSTQALLNQTHALVNEHRVSEVWSMVSRLTDLCNCESYSVNERAEIFLECGFIVSGLGSSFDAAEHFEEVIDNLGIAIVNHRTQAAAHERVKELTCLYKITQISGQHNISLERRRGR